VPIPNNQNHSKGKQTRFPQVGKNPVYKELGAQNLERPRTYKKREKGYITRAGRLDPPKKHQNPSATKKRWGALKNTHTTSARSIKTAKRGVFSQKPRF